MNLGADSGVGFMVLHPSPIGKKVNNTENALFYKYIEAV